ncbi:MAG TPA: hypothetical protein VF834_04790 [Streptosporangiaceae bacterium]
MAQAAPVRTVAVAQHQVVAQPEAPAWLATVLITCQHRGVVAPLHYVITCADANNVLVHLSWRSWRTRVAFGHGWDAINTCRPSCAAGHFRLHAVIVIAWGVRHWRGSHWFFTHLTLIYTQRRPPAGSPRVVTIPITRRGPG